jgi:hypothetical protein
MTPERWRRLAPGGGLFKLGGPRTILWRNGLLPRVILSAERGRASFDLTVHGAERDHDTC